MEHKKIKTATDILAELELKIDSLVGAVKNIENAQTVLLANFNKFMAQQNNPIIKKESSASVPESNKTYKFEDLPKTNKFEQLKQSYGITDGLTQQERPEAPRRIQRTSKEPSKNRVSVRQKIVNETGGPIFLAAVEVLNQQQEVVARTRTDNNGTWKASLEPGDYEVVIIKRAPPDSGKKQYSVNYKISLNGQSPTVDFEPFLIQPS